MTGSDVILGVITGRGRLYRGTGDDRMYGGIVADYLLGRTSNARLYASGGNDAFWGGTGNDLLVNGTGRNTFISDFGNGIDTIRGFQGNGRDDANVKAVVSIANFPDLVARHLVADAVTGFG